MINDYGYIFVLTYGRSGSTLLMKLINSIDGVDISGENNNACFHLFRAINGIDRAKAKQDGKLDDIGHPWHGLDRTDASAFRTSLTEAFLRDVLSPLPGTRITGFKEVRHHPRHMSEGEFASYVDFLLESFPDAKIVFNTRDAHEVAHSGWYKSIPQELVVERISAATGWFRALAGKHERAFVIDYAEVADGGSGLPALFKFLDAPYDADRVQAILDEQLTHLKGTPGTASRVKSIFGKLAGKGK